MNKKTLSIACRRSDDRRQHRALSPLELPSYEANGFPVSPMQVRVLGAAHVQQQETAPRRGCHHPPGERADAAQGEDRDHRRRPLN